MEPPAEMALATAGRIARVAREIAGVVDPHAATAPATAEKPAPPAIRTAEPVRLPAETVLATAERIAPTVREIVGGVPWMASAAEAEAVPRETTQPAEVIMRAGPAMTMSARAAARG